MVIPLQTDSADMKIEAESARRAEFCIWKDTNSHKNSRLVWKG